MTAAQDDGTARTGRVSIHGDEAPPIVGGRFVIERVAGQGGMGTVYRGRDEVRGEPVAVKILQRRSVPDVERFLREVEVLSELERIVRASMDPAQQPSSERSIPLVRYVAHGLTDHGAPYLVMEWLEGENLDTRLARTPLTIDESVELVQRVAEALAPLHARGLVHRDIKPSNLFLCDGRVERVKIIDFGIARLGHTRTVVTRSGTAMGTPGYMAPEQARGAHDVDPRADVFSLGCVLFECIAGRPAFAGDHVMAVLAKLLLEEPPPLRDVRADVPAALEGIVARMLSKDAVVRPADGAEVALGLAALEPPESIAPLSRSPRSPNRWSTLPDAIDEGPRSGRRFWAALTSGEQRLASVLLVAADGVDTTTGAPRAEPTTLMNPGSAPASELDRALRSVLVEFGATVDRLADGTRVLTLTSGSAATDQAAQAARCALAARAALPGRAIAVATGRARVGGRAPAGEVIDRAAGLLRDLPPPATAGDAPILLDELTAKLVNAVFHVEATASGALRLVGEREPSDASHKLLGKRTSCVGRDRDLMILQATLEECASEPTARAVLITAGVGVGKSRLRQEFVERVRQRDDEVKLWIAGGDPMRAGAPLGLLGQVVRRAARLLEGEPLAARQQKLRARVERHVDAAIACRVTEFLGELVGVSFPDHDSVQLRAARQDPMLMGDQMRRAWVDFVAAECAAHPVVLVLEDLHWGDRSTVEYVDTTLRLLGDAPLMVLALARPEVHDLFPRLWADRQVQEMPLGELSRKACDRLAREVLGEHATPEVLAKLWEQSTGNAFFLEELLRAEVEAPGDDVPDTVLAMVQSRLGALDAEARRVLRAGSVFGEVFWRGSAAALLGGEALAVSLDKSLAMLEQREWIVRRPEAKFQNEREYAFRHGLVREAAYGMLTEEDRALGHRLAGIWLEEACEQDAAVVAGHYERGGALEGAAEHYRRAAEQALGGNDLEAVIERADQAIACGASGETLGALAFVRAEAHVWRGEYVEASLWADRAMEALPVGSPRWCAAVHAAARAVEKIGSGEQLFPLAAALLAVDAESAESGPAVAAMARVMSHLLYVGGFAEAEALHARLSPLAERFRDDPAISAHLLAGLSVRALFDGDVAAYRQLNKEALACFEQTGDVRSAVWQRAHTGYACNELGAYEEGEELLRAALADAERLGLAGLMANAKLNLGFAVARRGAPEEGIPLEIEAALAFAEQGHKRLEGAAHVYLAMFLQATGDLDAAEDQARHAVSLLTGGSTLLCYAEATLASVLFARRSLDDARAWAERATGTLAAMGSVEEGEAFIRLVHAEILDACGEREAARVALRAARDRLLARAGKIADPEWRERFLSQVPEHARTLALALACAET